MFSFAHFAEMLYTALIQVKQTLEMCLQVVFLKSSIGQNVRTLSEFV